ncbi:probable phosphoserine phosphatase [Marinomonas sp. MED121]|uniref:phosphoserine phosphatase SerB n=1 Tax=Marinomonas sp. MED121 TaxID=314277 RepID=UPI0000691103|nr:phosphoserine phosphatase SerB [Marinomonas sp. MED121]EAQ67496.1 probable phosphoserine phosphatase [Marinomonas sp. MED121]
MSASITLLGAINQSCIEQLESWLTGFNKHVERHYLTDSSDPVAVQRWILNSPFSKNQEQMVRTQLLAFSNQTSIDHVYQNRSVDISRPGLAVFDMDSTLIKAEVMDELAVEAGIGEKISAITASAMRGEIDFTESFVQRLSLLEGLSCDVMDGVFDRIQYMDGIEKMMKVINHFNWHTAILSGGFTFFADKIKHKYHFNEVHANVLEINDNQLTGKHLGPIVDASRKKFLLETIMREQGFDQSQTIACGDGANDLLMLNTANLGVALHAKPLVREQAPHPVNQLGLDCILYLLGMTSSEIRQINL